MNSFCSRNGERKGLIGKHLPAGREKAMEINRADVAELVDARDLKSLDGNVVWVRVPPPAPPVPSRWPSRSFGRDIDAHRLFPREYQDTVRRDHDHSGRRKSMHRFLGGADSAAIAGDPRVDPVIIDIAVEPLDPDASGRESDLISMERRFRE